MGNGTKKQSKAGKHPGGRPPVEIDLAELEKLCSMQCTYDEIAAWFKVSTRTIEARAADPAFREVMDRGYAIGRISVRRHQIQLLEKGNATMAIWLGKQLLGQRDHFRHELMGKDGGPIQQTVDLTRLSDEELAQLEELAKAAAGAG